MHRGTRVDHCPCVVSQQRGKDVPQDVRDRDHRAFIHPCRYHEFDRQVGLQSSTAITLSLSIHDRQRQTLYTSKWDAAITHPLVSAIVNESQAFPVHHLARPAGVLSVKQV